MVPLTQLAFTCSKSTVKILEQYAKSVRRWHRSGAFIVNFEQVNAGWEISFFEIPQNDGINLDQDHRGILDSFKHLWWNVFSKIVKQR